MTGPRDDEYMYMSDELGRDMRLAEALAALDPTSRDPNYWFRFRAWVLRSASRELARRRLMAQLTVGDVMESWARTVIPTAVLAAALAGVLLIRGATLSEPGPVTADELIVTEVEGETLPMMLESDDAGGAMAFASEIF